jgi:GNAT superfamily N-acetyltransferase
MVFDDKPYEVHQGQFRISTDKALLDVDAIHGFLKSAYWSPGIERALVERSIEHALCFGVYAGERQAGFARVITDRARFAYLADVFVLPEYRGQGLSKWLVATILDHPELRDVWRWLLATRDAHGLYAQFGFAPLADPVRWMLRGGLPSGTSDPLTS